jgi:hypothetical protein
VAGGEGVKEEQFVADLFQKLKKSNLKDPSLSQIEVHFYKNEERVMKAQSYKIVGDKIQRRHL